MNEFWVVFWNEFWKICQKEIQNVSLIKLIIISLIGIALVHMGCLIYVRVKRDPIYIRTELMIILLVCYVGFIAQVTLLSRISGGQVRAFETKWLWFEQSLDQNITNLLNIFLFLPLGFLAAGIQTNNKSMKRSFMVINYCFLLSLLIECAQYITKRGYFEINDIEANIVGGLVGSIFFSLCTKIGRLINKKNREVENEKEA